MEYILFLPLILSVLFFLLKSKIVRDISLAFSLTYFCLSLAFLFNRLDIDKHYQFISYNEVLTFMGGSLNLGLDGLSMLMVCLTNFVILFTILKSWTKGYSHKFYALLMLMNFALLGVFMSMNLISFYVFWELALFPIYFIVYRWGEGEDKLEVVKRFFIYTFVGSLIMLGGIIALKSGANLVSLDITSIMSASLTGSLYWIFSICMFIGLGVKIPVFLLHSWQPKTYKTAPSEGVMVLSGVMLKMGIYGMYRWFVPFQENIPHNFHKWLIILCVIGVLYGAIIALRRNDMKLIAAFSSLSHVGLIVAGLLTLSFTGLQGSVIQMIVHGINIVGVFYIIDVIEEYFGTRDIHNLGGIAKRYPWFSLFSFIIILGTIAVPLTNGFPGEMMLLYSVFEFNKIIGVVAGFSIIIGAAYMLRVFQLSYMGDESDSVKKARNIPTVHYLSLGVISFLVLVIGIVPNEIIEYSEVISRYLILVLE